MTFTIFLLNFHDCFVRFSFKTRSCFELRLTKFSTSLILNLVHYFYGSLGRVGVIRYAIFLINCRKLLIKSYIYDVPKLVVLKKLIL